MHDPEKWEAVFRSHHAQTRNTIMVRPGPNQIMIWSDGRMMRRVFAIAFAGVSLGGCSSFSMDYFKPAPAIVQVQLESNPPGADARTSLGPGCKTPCSVSLTAPPENGFTVSYTLPKFQPVTIPVQVSGSSGSVFSSSSLKIDPNPVVAELQPMTPLRAERKMMRPKKPKKPKATDDAPPQDPGQAAPAR
jgi:hypothetical protein